MFPEASVYLFHAWLTSAALQPDIIKLLLEEYETAENVYHAFIRNAMSLKIPAAGMQILRQNASASWLKKTNDSLLQHRIKAFTFLDSIYPSSLLHIQDPPSIMFYQGNMQCLTGRVLAIVGSRTASYDGQNASRKIARELSAHGVRIVSGMADGIDSASHCGCIEGKSPTIAVTGCGLDRVYPSGNARLRDQILQSDGLLLSEYPPGEKPDGWHFPFRNRIISGIAQALIVMEAKIRSGTMTSVQHALNQGKDVFVYPGDPVSPNFEGNHQLLREGARYFTTAEDILEDMEWLDNPEIIRQNSDCSGEPLIASTPEEDAVITVLKPGRLSFEQIAEKSRLSPAMLLSTLTMLQIKGAVEALPGKVYQLKFS